MRLIILTLFLAATAGLQGCKTASDDSDPCAAFGECAASSSSSSSSSTSSSSSSTSSSGLALTRENLNIFIRWNQDLLGGYLFGNYRHILYLADYETLLEQQDRAAYSTLLRDAFSYEFNEELSVVKAVPALFINSFTHLHSQLEKLDIPIDDGGMLREDFHTELVYKVDKGIDFNGEDCLPQQDCVAKLEADISLNLFFPVNFQVRNGGHASLPNGVLTIRQLRLSDASSTLELAQPAELRFSHFIFPVCCGGGPGGDPAQLFMELQDLSVPKLAEFLLKTSDDSRDHYLKFNLLVPNPIKSVRQLNEYPNILTLSAQGSPISGQLEWGLDKSRLRADFEMDLKAAQLQADVTQIYRDVIHLWAHNSSWNAAEDSFDWLVNYTVILDGEPVLASRQNISVADTERAQYETDYKGRHLQHTHVRDLTGDLQSVQAEDSIGLDVDVSYITGKAQGAIRNAQGDTLAEIIGNNFDQWSIRYLE